MTFLWITCAPSTMLMNNYTVHIFWAATDCWILLTRAYLLIWLSFLNIRIWGKKIDLKNRNRYLAPTSYLSDLCMDQLLTLATARVGYKTCNVLLAFLSFSGGKKSSWGITWSRALHVLHSRRLRRDYPKPDVSLSKEKNMLSAKKQPYRAIGKRQAAGRRRSAVWTITPAVSEYARFQV